MHTLEAPYKTNSSAPHFTTPLLIYMHNTMSNQPPKMIETSQICPPNGTVPSTTLSLNFFDVPWLSIPPVESLLFYSYPNPTESFLKEFLPNLKQSLSITLQHFFPYASSLIIPPRPGLPYLRYIDGQDSSLPFIVVESVRNDFDHLRSDSPKDAKMLDDFMPKLPPPHVSPEGFQIRPIMAMQVTIFPGYGICIGNTSTHVVGDGVSFSNFMKFWMSLSNKSNGGDPSLPIHSCRNAIKDPGEVASGYLEQFWSQNFENQHKFFTHLSLENTVRATFTMRRNQIDNLKRWITEKTSPVSTFVVTLALAWVTLIKTLMEAKDEEDDSFHLVFNVDCRNRLRYEDPIPSNYVGNCKAPGFVTVKKEDLVGEHGVLAASNAISACIKEMLSSDIVKTAPTWRQRLEKWVASRLPVIISGAPRLGLYDLDFGLGKPCKLEIMHTKTLGTIAFSESRDGTNGVEIGLVLDKSKMEVFASILQHGTY